MTVIGRKLFLTADRPKRRGAEDKATTCQSAEAHHTFEEVGFVFALFKVLLTILSTIL